MPPSPVPPVQAVTSDERDELLGSLTTDQQQRTSARVIKKLKLDDAAADKEKKDKIDVEIHKLEDKDKHIVKQRIPKAIWSASEKDLFFESLNEYGKDFDAITANICAKMKKKGVTDVNLKTKTQVSHFYYRTFRKISKYLNFDDNVKRGAQELYALINYGELRKKCKNITEKVCNRLGEMVANGSIVVRTRGRNVRVRTPMCRALRRLNQITERSCVRVCSRASVVLRARDAASWSRVVSAAHNPRVAANLPLATPLADFLTALATRWAHSPWTTINETFSDKEGENDTDNEVNMEDRINGKNKASVRDKELTLHVGPLPNAQISLPTLSPCEQLSCQNVCFSSYLERMGSNKDGRRTQKRQRKDSASEKDKDVPHKKPNENKLMDIDETAIDGIELMASLEAKILEKDKLTESEDDKERDLEKDSQSELEEECNKSDTDYDEKSDKDRDDRLEKDRKFKNLKVKFRIQPQCKPEADTVSSLISNLPTINIPTKLAEDPKYDDEVKLEEPSKNSIESLQVSDDLITPTEDPSKTPEFAKICDENNKNDNKLADSQNKEGVEEKQPELDLDFVMKQIKTGWSVYDCGHLTVGDLYLMFGSKSKLDLHYWWSEPSSPLPQKTKPIVLDHLDKRPSYLKSEKCTPEKDEDFEKMRESDNEMFSPKNVFGQDSNDGLSGDERKNELQVSPEHKGTRFESFRVADKLVNRPRDTAPDQRSLITHRLRRLISLANNISPRCDCSTKKSKEKNLPFSKSEEAPVFRHPTPIAPKPNDETELKSLDISDIPSWKRGRPRRQPACGVVVQRLLPLLPKLKPPQNNLIPVKIASNRPPAPPRLLPKPSSNQTVENNYVYVVSQCGNQFYLHDGNTKLPIIPENATTTEQVQPNEDNQTRPPSEAGTEPKSEIPDTISGLLGAETLSLSPSQLLRSAPTDTKESWLCGDVHDFSLSSFLAHLDQSRPHQDLQMDSQLQSLLTESSVDYIAKFADLAAEVNGESDRELTE